MSLAAEPTSPAPAATDSASPRRPLGRVVIATVNRPEGDTGVHTHTRMLTAGLRAAGVACDVVSALDAGKKWYPVFAVRPLLLHRINKTWSTLWHQRWHAAALREALLRDVRRQPPDVVVAQDPVSARAALDVRARVGGKFPVVLVCHFNRSEADEYRDKGELAVRARYEEMLAGEDRVLREVDRAIYVSNWARQTVEQSRGVTPRAASVIWNGIGDADHTPAAPLSRAQLGLGDDDLVLINVGSLEPRKNQLGLLELFAAVRNTHPSAKLVLVGDGPARREIEQAIADQRLGDSVLLLGHRRDVPAILPLADLYVHYATLENCPLVLIEAARAGMPFAAIPAGGVPELQAALDCRYEVGPQDLRRSAETIRPLLDSADARRAAGARARAKFESTFSLPAMTRAYIEALSASL